MASYRHLTDDELLIEFDAIKARSPIIEELCERLKERLLVNPKDKPNHNVECPVCQAQLRADYDQHNEMFELRFRDD